MQNVYILLGLRLGRREIKKLQMATKFSLSPDIKTLYLVDQNFDQNTVSILGQMMEKGNLSHLTKLSFNRCTGLKTTVALASSLSQLSELCLYRCKLDSTDYIALSSAVVSKNYHGLRRLFYQFTTMKDQQEHL